MSNSVAVYVIEAEDGEMSIAVAADGPYSRRDVRDAALRRESEMLEQICMLCRGSHGSPQAAGRILDQLQARLEGLRMYRTYILDDDTTINRNMKDCKVQAETIPEAARKTA
jgi:hypothetical protein